MTNIQRCEKLATEYAEANLRDALIMPVTEGERQHIVNIATSIIMTRDAIGYPGGSFVQAIVDNNLERAVMTADSTCIKALKFFVMVKLNIPDIKHVD